MAQARMAQARMAQAGLGSDLAGSQTLSTLLTTHLERSRARQTLVSTIEPLRTPYRDSHFVSQGMDSTGKGILIGMLSAFGSAILIASILAAIYFFRYTNRGRILLDRMGRPGEYDDEQAFAKEEADALAEMDDIQCAEYLRAKAFIQANPPESAQTDISLSQFLAIQEKGVSAWKFEPELEIANCSVEARTEIEFFDSICSVQSNLPVPKQNEVYYWEAKVYEKAENTEIAIGMTTKPYPLFRLPGFHKTSVSYVSNGDRRFNQPFHPIPTYGPPYLRGDVIGVGYRPRTGTVFFTRNGKKLDDVAHALKTQNLFPTVGATGPCTVHVNFGQMGFVFIEANVKKWGLAPMTGSLAPPPPYGSEQGSILLEGGHHSVQEGQAWSHSHSGWHSSYGASRTRSRHPPMSPGPHRSPTDISLAQFSLLDNEEVLANGEDAGEGASTHGSYHPGIISDMAPTAEPSSYAGAFPVEVPPPDYESPSDEDQNPLGISQSANHGPAESMGSTPRPSTAFRRYHDEEADDVSDAEDDTRLLQSRTGSPPIPSYDAAVGNTPR